MRQIEDLLPSEIWFRTIICLRFNIEIILEVFLDFVLVNKQSVLFVENINSLMK